MSKPAIRAQKLRIESAQKSIDIARAGYWPTLSLNGGIGTSYYHVNGGTNPAFGRQFKDNFNKSIGISLNIPIFDHFQTRNNIRMAKINYEGPACAVRSGTEGIVTKKIQTSLVQRRCSTEEI